MDTPADILDRQGFVNKIKMIVETLSKERKNCTFAINGEWGCGKSYVLNRFKEEIEDIQSEETASDKYLVFYYDCWKYDYYEEPAVAIIAAMLEMAEEKLKIINTLTDKAMEATWNVVIKRLETIVGEYCKNKVGVDLYKFIGDIRNGIIEESNSRNIFDNMFAFKSTFETIKKYIQEFSSNHTVIIIVDEIDRCLPQYAIKILERLHHIFFDISNVIVIIAVDGNQLDNTIKQIYGQKTNAEKYLKKFIDFQLNLDIGKTYTGYASKFASYFSKFKDHLELNEVMETLTSLLEDVDMRTQEKLFNKADTIHKFINSELCDISLLFFEMMWVIISYKQNSQNLRWVVNLGENINLITPVKIESDLQSKIMEISAQYCGPSSARIENESYLIIRNSAIGRAFFYLSTIYSDIEDGTCGNYYFENYNDIMGEILMAHRFVELTFLIQ